jgi:streptogramin lyase
MARRSSESLRKAVLQRLADWNIAPKAGFLISTLALLAGCGGGISSPTKQQQTTPTPTFSLAAGTYTTAQSVSISDTMPGVTIYYTTNGTTPTTLSSVYSGPITISATETLEAFAAQTGYSNSAVASAAYTIAPILPAPTLSLAAGTYTSAQSVSISDAMAGVTIYYTINGTTPTTSSSVYSSPVAVSATETLEAIAVETGYSNSPVASAAYTISPFDLNGQVLGSLSGVIGAEVQLYAAGSKGYGSNAIALLSPAVTTNNNGSFTISSANFVCPSNNSLTYLVATGGDPGVGSNNSAIALMTPLGACGSLNQIGPVEINEVTTVASVWALAPFIGSGSAGAEIGTSSTNLQGLVNAFANVGNLVSMSSGASPGASAPTAAVIPAAKINSLANTLETCVASNGATACTGLFTSATPPGGTAPDNTLDAALNIARNPSNNVGALFALAGQQPPFEPSLSAAPNDWTLALTFSGGGLNYPTSIAIDASGNVWTANYCGSNSPCSSATELSPGGQPLSPSTGFTDSPDTLWENYGLAIDPSGNVWLTNQQTANGGDGSVSQMSNSGQVGSAFSGGGIFFPVAVAADTNGNIWVANQGDSTVSKLGNDGSAISGSSGWGAGQLSGPSAVAIDANNFAWFANQDASSGSVTSISSDGSAVNEIPSGGEHPSGVATDQIGVPTNSSKGHVWIANYSSSSVSELRLNNDGTVTVVSTGYSGGGVNRPNGIAVDGSGNVWVANYGGNNLTELQGANGASPGQPLSPAGLGADANLREPYSIALDASGNVWVSNFGSSTITQILGAAMPVKTPLVGPPQVP